MKKFVSLPTMLSWLALTTSIAGCINLYEYVNYLEHSKDLVVTDNVISTDSIFYDKSLFSDENYLIQTSSQHNAILDSNYTLDTVPKSVHRVTLPTGSTFQIGDSIGSASSKAGLSLIDVKGIYGDFYSSTYGIQVVANLETEIVCSIEVSEHYIFEQNSIK